MKETVVLYPIMGWGHLVPMVELGKLMLSHQPSLSVTVLLPSPPNPSTADYIAAVSASFNPHIIFQQLPPISLPRPSATRPEAFMFQLLRLNNPNLHQALLSISKLHTIRALVVDFFCSAALSFSPKLNIPTYCFFTTNGAGLACFLYLPTLHRTIHKSFKDLNAHITIPGVPPIPSWDMPEPLLERNDLAYQGFLNGSLLARETAGIIVNTFEALEHESLRAIFDGLCVPDGPTPPVYPLGPLIDHGEGNATGHECLRWLDSQPRRSVVFLCFGSLGVFSKHQLHQLAYGLERSGHKFLWVVVRNPPSEKSHNLEASSLEDPDLDSLLPEGFMDRTQERGMVVKKWAPQTAVLNHGSVGGFVTHCGWNSVLEAVVAGVPMVAWPVYAEQRFNRVVMVEKIKIALWMREEEGGLVTAEEVEERVRELMESERGEMVRKRVEVAKDEAEAAWSEGGSSRLALAKLTESWKICGEADDRTNHPYFKNDINLIPLV